MAGLIYSRHGNPNYTMAEEKLAFLEGAEALAYSMKFSPG
jgi:O-acetylhomoserine/O-acetylserine sulfhydrylase-like pyridoxal-dependent enzyme